VEFTYEPNFSDNFHGVLFGFWGTRARAVRSVVTCVVVGVLSGLLLWASGLSLGLVIVLAVIASVAWGALFTVGLAAILAASLTKRHRAIGASQIVVTPEGIERISGASSVRKAWSDIARVEETKRVFFLYDAENPVFAIEKSAVGEGEALGRLRQFLRERKPGAYLGDETA
jgi:hypothetical protein